MSPLTDLPNDILVMLPEYIHTLEDFTSLSSTSRTLRKCLLSTSPKIVLRLAAEQTKVFFRPSPHFLVAATARELGDWARRSLENEVELRTSLENGIEGLFQLCLEHSGLTLERIRDLHAKRFSIINPVTDLIDKCVGEQWYALPNFWDGGVDDAYTIYADPPEALFHLAIYGELFGPDFDTFLEQQGGDEIADARGSSASRRMLSIKTRIEYVKYCIPDWASKGVNPSENLHLEHGDSLYTYQGEDTASWRLVKSTGPYRDGHEGKSVQQDNIALTWLLKSSRWRPHWREMRAKAGVEEFDPEFRPGWWTEPDEFKDRRTWQQELMENVMVCQGLDGLGMIRPELQEQWKEKVREWHGKIARITTPPRQIEVLRQCTAEHPFLRGDLRILVSGYVPGT